jgi:lipopolysaccharide export system protein LptA
MEFFGRYPVAAQYAWSETAMRFPATILLPVLLLALPAAAADKVEVKADSMVVNDADHQAVFSGNVVITHPDVTLSAPKAIVKYGDAGVSDIESFEASGNVKLKTKDQTATGERAVYDPDTQLLRLSGNVVVVNTMGTMKGPELVVDLANHTSTFKGGSTDRVTVEFTPQ